MPAAIASAKAVAASAEERAGPGSTSRITATPAIAQPTAPTRSASRARRAAERIRVHWVATAKPTRPRASPAVAEPTPVASARSMWRKNWPRAGPAAISIAAPTTETAMTVRTETAATRPKAVTSPTRRSSDRCGKTEVTSGTTSTA
jgi:hypothetical protein